MENTKNGVQSAAIREFLENLFLNANVNIGNY